MVDIFRRPEFVPDIVNSAIASGIRAVWMQFGVAHQGAAETASSAGLDVIVDRCILVEHSRLTS
jgi:predicted CoA-binding protein